MYRANYRKIFNTCQPTTEKMLKLLIVITTGTSIILHQLKSNMLIFNCESIYFSVLFLHLNTTVSSKFAYQYLLISITLIPVNWPRRFRRELFCDDLLLKLSLFCDQRCFAYYPWTRKSSAKLRVLLPSRWLRCRCERWFSVGWSCDYLEFSHFTFLQNLREKTQKPG